MTITPDKIKKAVNILHSGGLVAFPTETVYGLGADANNEAAIRKIFLAKERPFDHPLIVHIAKTAWLTQWACDVSPAAMKLASAFWPGPLTLILKKQPHVSPLVTGNQDTIGLRIPRHPVAQALLLAFGGGIAAPSANKFTHISPTTAEAVYEELGGSLDLILDGGSCEVGLESTIIDMSASVPTLLRPGMISASAIASVLGSAISVSKDSAEAPRSPGMHHLHYAPTTKTSLIETAAIPLFLQSLKPEDLPLALVLRSKLQNGQSEHIQVVNMPQAATDYAHDLYQTLRLLDNQKVKQIIIETVPDSLEWEAIRDRLNKASSRIQL